MKQIGENKFEDTYFGETQTLKDNTIPKAHTGEEFNYQCYARKNPEVAREVGNDRGRLTSHWRQYGSKENLDASCGPESTVEERIRAIADREQEEERVRRLKEACTSRNRFFRKEDEYCDGARNADGSENTKAKECREDNGFFDYQGNKTFCNIFKNPDGSLKTRQDYCNTHDNYWDKEERKCDYFRNIDGTLKSEADVCTGFDSFWDPKTKRCITDRDRDGKDVSDEQLCLNNVSFWDGKACDDNRYPNGLNKSGKVMCKIVDAGTEYTGPDQPYSPQACRNKLNRHPNSRKQKRAYVDKYVLSPEMRFNEKLMKQIPELAVSGFTLDEIKGKGKKKLKGGRMTRDEYNALLQRSREDLKRQINDTMEKQRIEFDKIFDKLVNEKLDLLQYDASKEYDQFDVVSIRDPRSTSKYKAKLFTLTDTDRLNNRCNPDRIIVTV